MRPGLKSEFFAKFTRYCKYRDEFQLKELIACNHKKNTRGCDARFCPLIRELAHWAQISRLDNFWK